MTDITVSAWTGDSYARVASELAELRSHDADHDPVLRSMAESILHREAWLLDSGDLDGWMAMMAGDCLYWIPANSEGGDPTTEVSLAFDDHRRLTDRVYWLATGLVFAQTPASRTRRLITNVTAWEGPDGRLRVRSNFLVHEYRAGRQRLLSGWYGHVISEPASPRTARIHTKVVLLNDADQGHDNLTLVF